MIKKTILFCSIIITFSIWSDPIVDLLNNYSRPFTFLEIGEPLNIFSSKLATSYNGVFVILNTLNTIYLKDYYSNLIVLNHNPSHREFFDLARCEFFDVAFVHNLLQLFQGNWEKSINFITILADHVFVQESKDSDFHNLIKTSQLQYLQIKDNLYLFNFPTKKFYQNHFFSYFKHSDPQFKPSPKSVYSNFSKKYLVKSKKKSEYEWIPGINLVTFVALSGSYPSRKNIKHAFTKLPWKAHPDLALKNVIITGNALHLIDYMLGVGTKDINADYKKILFCIDMTREEYIMQCIA